MSTPTPTTCSEPPFGDAVAVEGTANTSVEGNQTGVRYDALVRNGRSERVTVAVRVVELTRRDCDPVPFERAYELAPGAEAVVYDMVVGDGAGELVAVLPDGTRAGKRLDRAPTSATGYHVRVTARGIDITRILA